MNDEAYDILIIDNNSHFRETAAEALRQAGCRVQESGRSQEGLRWLEQRSFNLVLLELNVGKGDSLALMYQIRNTWPDTGLIIITANASLDSAIAALRCRAADYRCKPLTAGQVLSCVQQALARQAAETGGRSRLDHTPVNGQLKLDTMNLFFNSEQGFGMSRREYQVLMLMLTGAANKEIARRLSISINTVKTHIRHLYRKMEINSRREALALAREKGLIT